MKQRWIVGPTSPTSDSRRDGLQLDDVAHERQPDQVTDDERGPQPRPVEVTEGTAGTHGSNILGKLGVRGGTEAAAVTYRLGLVD